ncbi:MAG: hypothetical protein ACI84C_000835 [Flavobacteriales bacterium]
MSFSSVEVERHLGFNLMPTWPGALVTYAEITIYKGDIIDFKSISELEFIVISLGKMKSAANPNQSDFLQLYDIPHCEVEYIDDLYVHQIRCNTIQSLWKLRYRFPPGAPSTKASIETGSIGGGWTLGTNGANAPSPRQREILKTFGMKTLADFVWGGRCYRLVKATTEPSWLSSYRQ